MFVKLLNTGINTLKIPTNSRIIKYEIKEFNGDNLCLCFW